MVDGLLATSYVSSSNKFPLEFRAWQHALFFAQFQWVNPQPSRLLKLRPAGGVFSENEGAPYSVFSARIQQALVFTLIMRHNSEVSIFFCHAFKEELCDLPRSPRMVSESGSCARLLL